jgi:hypothetical protein
MRLEKGEAYKLNRSRMCVCVCAGGFKQETGEEKIMPIRKKEAAANQHLCWSDLVNTRFPRKREGKCVCSTEYHYDSPSLER